METPSKVCCIVECGKPVIALGLCVAHWRRNKLYGSPMALKNHSGMFKGHDAIDRFYMQVDIKDDTECWLWTSGKDKDGYGSFRGDVDGVSYSRAHRYSYAYFKGEITNSLQVLHSCDTPSCCNPEHLSLGTNSDNMADRDAKGRCRAGRPGETNAHAVLTEKQVLEILKDPSTHANIAHTYGISRATVSDIKRGHSWGYLEGAEVVQSVRPVSHRQGASKNLNEEKVKEIRKSTESYGILAARYNISVPTVCDIRKRKSWKHVE
jgi:hypothetical protein